MPPLHCKVVFYHCCKYCYFFIITSSHYYNDVPLTQGLEQQLRTETGLLRETLSQREKQINTLKNELLMVKDSSKRDLSSMFSSVQELKHVDSVKDQSIAALTQERDLLTADKSQLTVQLHASLAQADSLQVNYHLHYHLHYHLRCHLLKKRKT